MKGKKISILLTALLSLFSLNVPSVLANNIVIIENSSERRSPPPSVDITFVVPAELIGLFPNQPTPERPYFWALNPGPLMWQRAVIGGYEEGNRTLYICQALFNGTVQPGKVVSGRCNITYGGAEIVKDNFRVLIGRDLDWRQVKHGRIPSNAVPGGFENGHPIYICRADYGFHGQHPGKIVGNFCNIGYAGREIMISKYDVLKFQGP